MEEMMRKFKQEFKDVYFMYLDADDAVDALNENSDEYNKQNTWGRFKRKSGQMYELRKVAKILGYTSEDINSWEEEVYNEYMKSVI